jgi:putative adhesin
MSEMTEEFEDVVRQQSFTHDGPAELDIAAGPGRIDVRLVDEPGVHVEVRHDPDGASPFAMGVSNLMNWLNTQFGPGSAEPSANLATEAVRQTRVDFTGGRLVVRTPKDMQLRNVAISVSVQAPVGSHVTAKSGSGDVAVSGAAGRLELLTGSGRISADQAAGSAKVDTGSGVVRLGPMASGVRAKTGSGDVEVTSVGGVTTVITGSGDVWLGAVSSDVLARTGSGNVTVTDASAGQLELHTGSGEIRIGVRAGSPAEIDLSSGSGEARSELDLSSTPPDSAPSLRIRGRTGSGSALVSAAAD